MRACLGNSSLRDAHTDKVVVLQHGVTSARLFGDAQAYRGAKMQAACIFAIAQLAAAITTKSEFEMLARGSDAMPGTLTHRTLRLKAGRGLHSIC